MTFLVKKWAKACDEYPLAQKALLDMTPTRNPRAVEQWKKMAVDAAANRRSDPTAMDIYDVQHTERKPWSPVIWGPTLIAITVPTRKQIQLELTHEENSANTATRGIAGWISNGLRIEELQ